MALRRWMLVLPWAALLGWAGWIGKDALETRKLADAAWVASRVDGVDAHRRARHAPVELVPRRDGALRVWVLGSSTIVPRVPGLPEHPLATSLRARGIEAVVDDLALTGMPTWEELDRLEDALAAARDAGVRPDLLVFYGECNDVTYTFHLGLELPHFHALTGLAYVASGEAFTPRAAADDGGGLWFYAHRRAPVIVKALQRAGLLTLDPAAFTPFRERVHRVFEENVRALVDKAGDVPVLLVPPVGDLEAEPYGPLATTTDVWAEGMATTDPVARRAKLTAARDAEVFTPDMRVDSTMIAMLQALGRPAADGPAPVTSCDLAERLDAAGGPLRHADFVDPVHFDEAGYQRVIDVIADCVRDARPVPPAPTP